MIDSLYMASQYLRHHKLTSLILTASMTLIFFLPSALFLVVDDATEHFRSRAGSTPLLVGARGSSLDLVLSSLYFDSPPPDVMPISQMSRLRKLELGQAIPLHTGIRSGQNVIVGTSNDYFTLRNLNLDSGHHLTIIGECVVGSRVADDLGLSVGSKIPVSRQKAFVLGDAPLRINVVGILAPTDTPDDEVILVDLKTVWIVEGLGHGHMATAKHGSKEATEYTDITIDNVASFHFHGDESEFPITSIIVVPENERAETLLLGEYLSPKDTAQIVRPSEIMDGLMAQILSVRSYIFVAIALVSLVTLAVIALVIMLSLRLREREISTMVKMGCTRSAIRMLVGFQILIVVGISVAVASGMTVFVAAFGHDIVRALTF